MEKEMVRIITKQQNHVQPAAENSSSIADYLELCIALLMLAYAETQRR